MYKACILAVVLLGLAACTTDDSSTKEVKELVPVDYASWHTGKFHYTESSIGTYLINRTDSIQEEFIKSKEMVVEFDIRWQNDSMYTLIFSRINENPHDNTVAEGVEKLVKKCTITNVTEKSYVEKATSNLMDNPVFTTIFRNR
ncbi:hypothetical protein OAD66_01670 [Bacteroidia bacterium]|nr:hypothetical protein [Bacteroidia bacterium]MDB9881823.1 hypothetical protein [Bacteroidia bacterium]